MLEQVQERERFQSEILWTLIAVAAIADSVDSAGRNREFRKPHPAPDGAPIQAKSGFSGWGLANNCIRSKSVPHQLWNGIEALNSRSMPLHLPLQKSFPTIRPMNAPPISIEGGRCPSGLFSPILQDFPELEGLHDEVPTSQGRVRGFGLEFLCLRVHYWLTLICMEAFVRLHSVRTYGQGGIAENDCLHPMWTLAHRCGTLS